jgi:hypothetical protein
MPCTVPDFVYSAQAEPSKGYQIWYGQLGEDQYTCKVTAYDGLHWHNFGFFDQHGAALQLTFVLPDIFWHGINICGDHMIGNHVSQLPEPKGRYLVQ